MLAKFPWRSRSASPLNAETLSRPPLKFAQSTLPDTSDLRELNQCLSALAAIFPDVRPEVFREMLSTFSEVSRLQLVTECLLKNKAQWVQGRWKVPVLADPAHAHSSEAELPLKACFRNAEYKAAVKAALSEEFKGLSRSSLKAVLAEHNHSYTETRQALLTLSTQSWRYSVTRMLLRRKPVSTLPHALLEWRSGSFGASIPVIISTKCVELDEELERVFLMPLTDNRIKQQVQNDRELAEKVNEAEAEQAEAMFDCQCCFMPNPFESITACDDGGHYICSSCIRHTMTEAIYGQGWARSVNVNRSLLKCIAPSSTNDAECSGCISRIGLEQALAGQPAQSEILAKFEDRLAAECLSNSRMRLLKCPFCIYAEFEDVADTVMHKHDNQSLLMVIGLAVLVLCLLDFLLEMKRCKATVVAVLAVAASQRHRLVAKAPSHHHNITQLPVQHFGRRFTCRSPACGRISCLSCSSNWTDIHICYQSSRQALRTYVESAVTDAVKRTCPQCNVAFVKSSGCNKLVCVCKYTMCYVCRSEIGKEGYLHFCQHFRPDPGQACRECDKCDLYRVEDEEVVIKRAKEKAIKEWKEREGLAKGSTARTEDWDPQEEADGIGRSMVSRRHGR